MFTHMAISPLETILSENVDKSGDLWKLRFHVCMKSKTDSPGKTWQTMCQDAEGADWGANTLQLGMGDGGWVGLAMESEYDWLFSTAAYLWDTYCFRNGVTGLNCMLLEVCHLYLGNWYLLTKLCAHLDSFTEIMAMFHKSLQWHIQIICSAAVQILYVILNRLVPAA